MNQIDQLRALRDEAQARIEAARRALEESPDGKMVASLDALIEELETCHGESADQTVAESAAMADSARVPEENAEHLVSLEAIANGVEENGEPQVAGELVVEEPEVVAAVEASPIEIAPDEVASVEVAPVEIAPVEIATDEVAPVEVAPDEVATDEVAPDEVAPVESAELPNALESQAPAEDVESPEEAAEDESAAEIEDLTSILQEDNHGVEEISVGTGEEVAAVPEPESLPAVEEEPPAVMDGDPPAEVAEAPDETEVVPEETAEIPQPMPVPQLPPQEGTIQPLPVPETTAAEEELPAPSPPPLVGVAPEMEEASAEEIAQGPEEVVAPAAEEALPQEETEDEYQPVTLSVVPQDDEVSPDTMGTPAA